uniref:receptor protein-tyrosine kinase n=1 Tax=Caenorhabditis japonica TaxID=281687 RepID=A0A8R1I5H5_CAEJA
MNLFLLSLLVLIESSLQGLTSHYRENIPRFKHVTNERHEVFLGDRLKLDCQTAGSKVPAVVEWYRNEKLLKDDHIDHFCDYFLIPDISRDRIPMECVCLWRYNKEAKRPDVDYRAATGENCAKYASRMIHRARKPFSMIPCFGEKCNGFDTTPVSDFTYPGKEKEDKKDGGKDPPVKRVVLQKDDISVPLHETDELNHSSSQRTVFINAGGDEDEENEEEYSGPKSVSPDRDPTELNITVAEPPYFKSVDSIVLFNETHALPAGRTLKLNCRAHGYPEPEIFWYKNGEMITKDTARNGGYEYKFKRWSLEVEDAVTADSGNFHCEAINMSGMTRKFFNVIIVNRMRRPPIIVPNILNNQSVNVNDTATFNCKVVSDLLPHIMWVRINKVNGSYSYFNNSAKEYMFNYTEMDTIDKAHVHHIGDESTLMIYNVSLEDQGIYACLSGNSLGMTMANATLTVNEFRAIHLLTGDEPKPDTWSASSMFLTIMLLLMLLLATLFGIYVLLYRLNFHKKGMLMEDTVGLVAKKKRVVVSKRPLNEEEEGEDGTSPYQIQIIETPITKKEAAKKARKRANSENTVLSEYEVDSDPKWEIERTRLNLVHMLGEGAFGEVWKATLKESDSIKLAVAVKKLKMSAHEKELIDLVSEMETFKVIGQHENVLRLIGCCTGAGPLYVVVELCKYGNLRDFLRAHRPKEEKAKKSSQELTDYLEPRKTADKDDIELIPNLTQRHLVQFAWQVAQGMNFMANKKIIHRDLAARNVLVGDGHVLKISDFGLSRDVHCNDYYRKRGNGRLPIKWMALEALDSHVYTIESDVWSYGVLLWEIMTLGGTPYPTIAMPELYANLKEGYRMEPPHLCPQEVYHLMCSCWREKLEERPSFKTIVDYLDWMLTMTNETVDGSQEFNEQFFSERSTASGPVSPIDSFHKKRKHRPLSAPVNLPSEPQHTICDDYEPDLIVNKPDQSHLYCNDNMLTNHIITPETSQLFISKMLDEPNGIGYVAQDRLVRAGSGVANRSLDSALGSPAWPSYDRSSNNKASCLDQTHQYYNTNPKIQYLYFTFDKSDDMTRSRDSAIFEESYHPNYIQSHPLYSKILIKKNMTPHNSLPTKETIV